MGYEATIVQDFFSGFFLFLRWIVLATLLVCLFLWSNRRLSLGGQSGMTRVALRTLWVVSVLTLAAIVFVAISVLLFVF